MFLSGAMTRFDVFKGPITDNQGNLVLAEGETLRQVDLDCLGPEGYAEMERARAQRPQVVVVPTARPRPTLPPPRPRLTHCSEFQCFDDQGKGYPRAGPGRLPGPDGTCRSAGGRAPC